MTSPTSIIKTTSEDNVAIVVQEAGLPAGTSIIENIVLVEQIPFGHKVALIDFAIGDAILRYGQTIGYASQPIQKGEWINETKISLPTPPELDNFSFPQQSSSITEPLEGFTFEGYRNADGSVGTKNILGISTSVQCVAGLTEHLVKKIKQDLLPQYPNVDDVVALNHTYGCGIAINAPAAIVPIRTIKNLATNPNFGGEIMVIGLGCEKLRPEVLIAKIEGTNVANQNTNSSITYMQDESFQGFNEIVI